jgi:hypothetical protein
MAHTVRMNQPDPATVAASLRQLLPAIDAWEVTASDTERAYLIGAADTAERSGIYPSRTLNDLDTDRGRTFAVKGTWSWR